MEGNLIKSLLNDPGKSRGRQNLWCVCVAGMCRWQAVCGVKGVGVCAVQAQQGRQVRGPAVVRRNEG